MTNYSINHFRSGLKIILDSEPYVIESNEFVKPGKGQSFVRVKMRRLLTGQLIEKTFKSTDYVVKADVTDIKLIYLYNNKMSWIFFDQKSFEEIAVNQKVIADNKKWLIEQEEYTLTFWNDQPIAITIPKFVVIKIIKTNPGIKGDSVNTATKLATLSTGAMVKVPFFIQKGEFIKVNTSTGQYISRISK
ncbi:MAG: elongation factor P [Candidatus Dasytiphilus stammeri]